MSYADLAVIRQSVVDACKLVFSVQTTSNYTIPQPLTKAQSAAIREAVSAELLRHAELYRRRFIYDRVEFEVRTYCSSFRWPAEIWIEEDACVVVEPAR